MLQTHMILGFNEKDLNLMCEVAMNAHDRCILRPHIGQEGWRPSKFTSY